MEGSMGAFAILAETLRYPAPGQLERLEQGRLALPSGGVQQALEAFLLEVRALSLAEWEELYTRTWDLDPVVAPYVGFQVWGEDYRRGSFMSALHRAYEAADLEPESELPDHLLPLLRYLDQVEPPLPEVSEHFGPALERMRAVMQKRDPRNPYRHVLEGVREAWQVAVESRRLKPRLQEPKAHLRGLEEAARG
jgi:nitrate reductase delta subunit